MADVNYTFSVIRLNVNGLNNLNQKAEETKLTQYMPATRDTQDSKAQTE